MRKGCILVIVGVYLLHLLDGLVALGVCCYKDTSGKAAALRDEQHSAFITGTEFLHRLINLQQMLMGEGLIDRDIIVTLREVRCCTRLLTGSCTSRDTIHMHIATDDSCLQRRQHSQLNAGGKATRVG